jgi:hypothetical protein
MAIISTVYLLFGKHNIFNYVRRSNLVNALTVELQEKSRVRDRLQRKASIMGSKSSVDIDILESEAIRKLNRIPDGYIIIIE